MKTIDSLNEQIILDYKSALPQYTIMDRYYRGDCDLIYNVQGNDHNGTMDAMLYLAIQRAVKAICNYTGWDTISAGYEGTTATLALQYLLTDTSTARLFMGNPIITSQTQGGRSTTYKTDTPVFDADGLTASVKAALPLPMLKVY